MTSPSRSLTELCDDLSRLLHQSISTQVAIANLARDVRTLEREGIDLELRVLARQIRDHLAMIERWQTTMPMKKVVEFRRKLDRILEGK